MTDDLTKVHPRRRRRKRKRARHRKDTKGAPVAEAIPLAPPNLRLVAQRLRALNHLPASA